MDKEFIYEISALRGIGCPLFSTVYGQNEDQMSITFNLFSAHLGRDIAPQNRSFLFGGVERLRDVQEIEYLDLEYVEGRRERAHSCPVST